MRKASTWMLEKGTQTLSPSPDHIPAEHKNKTLTGNSHANWYIERGHLIPTCEARFWVRRVAPEDETR